MSTERINNPAATVGSTASPIPAKPQPAPARLAPPIAQTILRRESTANWRRMPMVTLASLLLHIIALGACTLIVIKSPQLVEEIFTTVMDNEEPPEPIVEQSMVQPEEVKDSNPEENVVSSPETTSNFAFETKGPIDLNVSDAMPQIEASDSGGIGAIPGLKVGSETSGRMSKEFKKQMVQKYGGNTSSEASVASGMKWLANHQMPNGSWSFEHSKHPGCKGQCSQDGTFKACPNGATGIALLAFLGGGHTHQKGDFKEEVKKGVDFLLKAGEQTPTGLDLRGKVTANEGMYVQGLCTIALCELSAMSTDKRVRKAAEGAIDFIVKAQNAKDGGWRYSPGDPGDTSVVGWQVMALKSAYNAKIKFPGSAFKGAEVFLKLVQAENGAKYKYVPDSGPEKQPPTPSMTAVGLLCRMYLGWDHSNKRLAEGVDYLDKVKPARGDMYYNYYATQVMHHWGGEEWTRWNEVMRDQLVRTQHPLKDGHLAGSWDVDGGHTGAGGRHLMTCFSIMTLEVYYRHLPMYSKDKIKVEF